MKENRAAQQGYFTTVATKISPTDRQKLCTIAEGLNLTFYELLQSLLLAIVRYFDKDCPISDELEKMMNAFFNVIQTTTGSFNPIRLKNRKLQTVKSAILFVQRKDGQQPQTIAIGKDEQGRLTETYNTDKMLADYLQATDPNILHLLEEHSKRMEFFSISHTLHHLILQHSQQPTDTISEEINTLFNDIRIPSGIAIEDNIYYKQKKNIGDYTQITPHRQSYKADY